MVVSSELRIGNWVKIRGLYEVQVIDNLGKEWFSYKEQNACYYRETEGIPLTPEILVACGLVSPIKNEFFFGRYSIRKEKKLDDPCWEIYLLANDATFNWLQNVRYLHELQNFIFALTGKELTYTPKINKP